MLRRRKWEDSFDAFPTSEAARGRAADDGSLSKNRDRQRHLEYDEFCWLIMTDKEILAELFRTAVDAANPKAAMEAGLRHEKARPAVVIGAGKASAQMARALEEIWEGPLAGTVVTRYGFGAHCNNIRIIEAGHPVPDECGLAASAELLELVRPLAADDLVIALISGGGSALLPSPPKGFSLSDEIGLNEKLLRCGAPISALNAVRKQFSTIKGGRLAAVAAPARVITLVVSDVPGDDPAMVASGPTVPDHSVNADAVSVIDRYSIDLPSDIERFISSGGEPAPSPDDRAFQCNKVEVVASAKISMESAAACASKFGLKAYILSDSIEGEAREVARVIAAIAKEVRRWGRPFKPPAVLLSGGETTVTQRSTDKNATGGPNTEFQLALAGEIAGLEGIVSLSADTDGIDGSGSNAGAFADGNTIAMMRSKGMDPASILNENNTAYAFEMIENLFVTGPTGTNVNDFRAILVR